MHTIKLRTMLALFSATTLLAGCPDDDGGGDATATDATTMPDPTDPTGVPPSTTMTTADPTPGMMDDTTDDTVDPTPGMVDSTTDDGGQTETTQAEDTTTTTGDETTDTGTTTDTGATLRCADAVLGGALPAMATGDNTNTGDNFVPSCGFMGGNANDYVYEFTAPEDGDYLFHTIGSDPTDTILMVLEDCDGQELACNDDINAAYESGVVVALTAGQVVAVVVDGFDAEFGNGPHTISVDLLAPPQDGGSCCVPDSGMPGCDVVAIESCVCDTLADTYCCATEWDDICVEEAVFCNAEC